MKSIFVLFVLSVFSTFTVAEPAAAPTETPATSQSAHPRMSIPSIEAPEEIKLTQKAKVLSVINAKQYTYLKVIQDKKTLWLAGAPVAVKKGDVVSFDDGMTAANYYSNTLKRTFPSVTFVNRVVVIKE